MHPMLNIAIRAVRMAGNLVAKYYAHYDVIKSSNKNNNDIIINVDSKVKYLIMEVIHKLYPQHAILSENSSKFEDEKKEVQWIIDPLNGTTNFIKRFPHFAVSIAVRIKGRTEIAVIYDPILNELFTASRGQGAKMNNCRLRCSTASNLKNTILATSFPFKQHTTNYISIVNKLLMQNVNFRCTGSTALDLAYVAADRINGFFRTELNPWDFVSGELLVREAGGIITDFNGGNNHMLSSSIVAGNPRVVKSILLILREYLIKNNKIIK